MDISKLLSYKFSSSEWSLNGEDYEGLVWYDKIVPKPTLSELREIEIELNNYKESIEYKELRRREYPPFGDQLDVILKQLNYDRLNGRELIQEMDDIIEQWLAIKDKYPKPEN